MAEGSRPDCTRQYQYLLRVGAIVWVLTAGFTCLLAQKPAVPADSSDTHPYPAIPADAELVTSNTTSIGSGNHYWVCNGATLTHTGARNVFYVEEGGQLKLTFGGGNTIYLSQHATLSLGSGADNLIMQHSGARVIRRKKVNSNRFLRVDSLRFNYRAAPLNGCKDGKPVNLTPLVLEVVSGDVDKIGFRLIGQFRKQMQAYRYLQEYKSQRQRFRIIISNSDPEVSQTQAAPRNVIGYVITFKASDSDRGTYLDSGIIEIRGDNLGEAVQRLLERFRKAAARFPHKLDFQSLDSAHSLSPSDISPKTGKQNNTKEN